MIFEIIIVQVTSSVEAHVLLMTMKTDPTRCSTCDGHGWMTMYTPTYIAIVTMIPYHIIMHVKSKNEKLCIMEAK